MNDETKNTEVAEKVNLPADLSNAVVNHTLQQYPEAIKAINTNLQIAALTLKYEQGKNEGLDLSIVNVKRMLDTAIENLIRQDALLYEGSKSVINTRLKDQIKESVGSIVDYLESSPIPTSLQVEEKIVTEMNSLISKSLNKLSIEMSNLMSKSK